MKHSLSCVNKMTQEIPYLEAKVNPELRQPYLDQIMPQCPESVEVLTYDSLCLSIHAHSGELLSRGVRYNLAQDIVNEQIRSTLFLVECNYNQIGLGKKQTIFSYEKGFNKLGSEAQFLNSLLDHEVYHANDFMDGINLQSGIRVNSTNVDEFNQKTIIHLLEFRGYDNQLKNLEKRGIHDDVYRGWLSFERGFHKYMLSWRIPKSELERKVLEEIRWQE